MIDVYLNIYNVGLMEIEEDTFKDTQLRGNHPRTINCGFFLFLVI